MLNYIRKNKIISSCRMLTFNGAGQVLILRNNVYSKFKFVTLQFFVYCEWNYLIQINKVNMKISILSQINHPILNFH